MDIIGLFKKSKNELEEGGIVPTVPDNEVQCPSCKRFFEKSDLYRNRLVCKACGYHFRAGARNRLRFTCDKDTFREINPGVISQNPLNFPGYDDKIKAARKNSRESEGVICGTAEIRGEKCALFVMDPTFMMGSMGTAVGERLARLFEYATENSLPVVGFTASGGARMQEGILSLMQMAKVSGAVRAHSDAGNLYITVLTDPTTGGVTASFAMQGDVIISEPGALIGFAGRRVVEQTTSKKLPDNFQSAEFMLDHGFVDMIVPRGDLRGVLSKLLSMHKR